MSSWNNDSFMGMPKHMAYLNNFAYSSPNSSPYGSYDTYPSYQPYISNDIAFDKWSPNYFKALYILASTYEPVDQDHIRALYTFLASLAQLIPNGQYRTYVQDFFKMQSSQPEIDLVSSIRNTVPSIFTAYPALEQELRGNPVQFLNKALYNKDGYALFIWVYLLHAWLLSCANRTTYNKKWMPSLNDQRSLYNPKIITKSDWGNTIWYILHTSSLYAPQPLDASFVTYKRMIYSLQWLLPCPKCRLHLAENLKHIDFDNCPRSNQDLFKCSWKLHNIVNKSENKREVPLQEAFTYYTY